MTRKTIMKTLGLLFITALLLSSVTGFVSAGAVTIDTSAVSTADGITTIPIYLTGADEIISFAASVSNTIPGVMVTISETMQPETGMSAVNSKSENSIQRVAWISSTGVTADKMPMFAVEVRVTDSSVTSVPLQITLTEIASKAEGMLPTSNYPVIQSSFSISDTISGYVSGTGSSTITPTVPTPTTPDTDVSESETPEQTVTPAVPENSNDSKVSQNESVPVSGETDSPSGTGNPQTPGFSMGVVLLSLASVAVLYRRIE